MDGLALGEHVRVLLVARLGVCKPLECGTVFGRCHIDAEGQLRVGNGVDRFVSKRNGEWCSVRLYSRRGQLEVGRLVVGFDAGNLEKAGPRLDHMIVLMVGRISHLVSRMICFESFANCSRVRWTVPFRRLASKSISKSAVVCFVRQAL